MLSGLNIPVPGSRTCSAPGADDQQKTEFMSQTNPTPYDHIVFTEFDGTEGILVDLNTKRYYQLNETAMLIWKSLEKGLAPSAIADQIVASYEVTPEAALQNVEQTLKDFETYRLIGIQERNGSSRARP
jgi:Coenzyme PQQ synthesis protein D (PqqD)